jgi:hypothetical protein
VGAAERSEGEGEEASEDGEQSKGHRGQGARVEHRSTWTRGSAALFHSLFCLLAVGAGLGLGRDFRQDQAPGFLR